MNRLSAQRDSRTIAPATKASSNYIDLFRVQTKQEISSLKLIPSFETGH